jgi:aspartyl-tRNA(Asn)/glutamyl-tRNA(Gln) amidotransferase subunit B
VLNKKAVEFATLAAMALNCRINETSIFARKLLLSRPPQGIRSRNTTSHSPNSASSGSALKGDKKKIGITRVHLEEDAGKSLHEGFPDAEEKPAIDLNRTGVPLIEIVSEPDLSTPDEAYEYLTRLKEIILYTGVSDCNREEGSLRCDANISVRSRGQKEFKTEIKRKLIPLHPRSPGV